MPLRDVAGHRVLTRLIARALDRASLPPSLLFVGPEGIGKRLVATAVAQTLNCEQPRRSSGSPSDQSDADELALDGCGACPSCERILRGVHPDVLLVPPGETGAIAIDAVRHATGQARYRPFEGRRRVVIVDDADRLAPQAQNALLKTLEEPPDSSQFILVTSRPDTLLATVRSRCQRLTFGPLEIAEVAEVLRADHGLDERTARAAAAASGGSVGHALQLSSGELTEAREAATHFLQSVATASNASARLDGAKALLAGKKPARGAPGGQRQILIRRLRAVASLLRDVTLIAGRGERAALANTDVSDELERLVPALGVRRNIEAFAVVDEAIAAAEGNASPKVVADWVACRV